MGKKKNISTIADAPPAAPLKNKEYEKELRRLHVELVKLQRWVVSKGLKVCIVFEGVMARAKAAPSKPLLNASVHVSSALSPCPPPLSAKKPALSAALRSLSAGGR